MMGTAAATATALLAWVYVIICLIGIFEQENSGFCSILKVLSSEIDLAEIRLIR